MSPSRRTPKESPRKDCTYCLKISYFVYKSPIGSLYIASTEEGICKISLMNSEDEFLREIKNKAGDCRALHDPDPFKGLIDELDRYFGGRPVKFSSPISFVEGTDFQRRVWRTVMRIPYGHISTYGEIAKKVGVPGGARAVGSALRRNPILLLVPCHRVVRSDGGLGGFGLGPHVKKYLLKLEGIRLRRFGARLYLTPSKLV